MKLLVLDNYDSFTYNLVHIVRELGYAEHMDVIRNDKLSLADISQYQKVLLSPGPGIPNEAGLMPEIIKTYATQKQFLGICLGHQGLAEAFGAEIFNMPEVLHGVATSTRLLVSDDPIFDGLPERFQVARYHSWSVRRESVHEPLRILAEDDEGLVMAMKHAHYQVYGLQFHPESVITEHGIQIMKNWLEL